MLQTLHPKVKAPAIVGTIVSIALGICSVVGQFVPEWLPITTQATTILLAASGYLTYSE